MSRKFQWGIINCFRTFGDYIKCKLIISDSDCIYIYWTKSYVYHTDWMVDTGHWILHLYRFIRMEIILVRMNQMFTWLRSPPLAFQIYKWPISNSPELCLFPNVFLFGHILVYTKMHTKISLISLHWHLYCS